LGPKLLSNPGKRRIKDQITQYKTKTGKKPGSQKRSYFSQCCDAVILVLQKLTCDEKVRKNFDKENRVTNKNETAKL
jgi:hypothetical protein